MSEALDRLTAWLDAFEEDVLNDAVVPVAGKKSSEEITGRALGRILEGQFRLGQALQAVLERLETDDPSSVGDFLM